MGDLRIAYFSPLSPQRSGIAAYSEGLLPYLAQHLDLDLFVDGYQPSDPGLARSFAHYDWHEFGRMADERRYHTALYHMGNSTYHEYVYRTLRRRPGVTVLHEFVLHHLMSAMTERRGDRWGFVREMAYAHGAEGTSVAHRYLAASTGYEATRYPLSRRVVDSSLGLIVHSEYVRRRVQEVATGVPVAVIPLPVGDTVVPPRQEARARLGLDERTLVIASFGLVTHEKRFHVSLPAFGRLLEDVPDAIFAVVGEVPDWYPLREWVGERRLQERVRLTGYTDPESYVLFLAAADICINLRYPTMGETSASLLGIMGAGVPAIVSDVGSYAEVPDTCCVKLAVGEGEEEALLQALHRLASDPEGRARLGQSARRYVREHHTLEAAAAAYARFIRSIVDP